MILQPYIHLLGPILKRRKLLVHWWPEGKNDDTLLFIDFNADLTLNWPFVGPSLAKRMVDL